MLIESKNNSSLNFNLELIKVNTNIEDSKIETCMPCFNKINSYRDSIEILLEIEAEYITQKGSVYGKLKILREYLIFDSNNEKRPRN